MNFVCCRHNLSSLKVLGSVGEPINPEAWMWYYKLVGGEKCAIVDTFWQTETGGHVLTPLPGAVHMKPGSAVSLLTIISQVKFNQKMFNFIIYTLFQLPVLNKCHKRENEVIPHNGIEISTTLLGEKIIAKN